MALTLGSHSLTRLTVMASGPSRPPTTVRFTSRSVIHSVIPRVARDLAAGRCKTRASHRPPTHPDPSLRSGWQANLPNVKAIGMTARMTAG
jgi:hypothetical protein